MFNTVDVIGADSICKLIRQTKLSKFIVFRGGSQRGSTPVFRCEDSRTPDQAIGAFKDWAESVLRMNPYNNLPYDLFLFSQKVDSKTIDAAIKRRKNRDDDDEEDDIEDTRSKKDRIRFTFSLNPFNNMQGGNNGAPAITADAIGAAVESALKKRDEENYVRGLEAKLARLENGEDDEEEEEEEEEENGALDKVYRVIKEINKAELIKKGKFAEAAGDDDDDEDDDEEEEEDDDDDDMSGEDDPGDDDEEEEEEKPAKSNPVSDKKRKKKLERIKEALKILAKADPHIDTDLMILAKIAKSKPKMFNNYMITLRNMNL